MWVQSLASVNGLKIQGFCSYGVGHRCGSDPALLWLWCRPPAIVPIGPQAWDPPYATGAALKSQKEKTLEGRALSWSPGGCVHIPAATWGCLTPDTRSPRLCSFLLLWVQKDFGELGGRRCSNQYLRPPVPRTFPGAWRRELTQCTGQRGPMQGTCDSHGCHMPGPEGHGWGLTCQLTLSKKRRAVQSS